MSFLSQTPSSPASWAPFAEPVAPALQQVEQRLESLLAAERCGVIYEVYQHLLKAGGKRLRPLLTLLSCQAAGGNPQKAVALATAVEAIHLASLLHDDVIDDASERRGRPSPRVQWGNRTCILAGDFLIAEVLLVLADEFEKKTLLLLANAVAQMCQAELAISEINEPPCEEDYFQQVQGKTAALMAAACKGGALVAENPEAAEFLFEYGRNIGIAFQITDDLLDLYGMPSQLGKPVYQDLLRGQWTLPLIAAFHLAGAAEQEQLEALRQAARKQDQAAAAQAAQLIEALGGKDYALSRAKEFVQAAQNALQGLHPSPARASLQELATFMINRPN